MLDQFPGLLGYGGIIAIHANWPMYPAGIGWKIALRALGNFPKGTKFYEIDDIDRCKLLINQEPNKFKDPFDYNNYQIATWHEDLIELKKKGLIKGIKEKSEYEFEIIRFENFKRTLGDGLKLDQEGNVILYIKDENGDFIESKHYKPECDEDEEKFAFRNCVIIPETISLTDKGIIELISLSKEISLSNELKNLVEPLMQIRRYDTAIRDASLLLETQIKNYHDKPKLFGQKLVDYHINEVIGNNDDFNSAAIKCYRGELRTIFKFIRNDFAHNFKILTEEQCLVILSRIDDAINEFKEVIDAYFNNNNT
jgi:hypothetical protein